MALMKKSSGKRATVGLMVAGVLAGLVWTKLMIVPGSSEVAGTKGSVAGVGPASNAGGAIVEVSDKQATAVTVGPVVRREFTLLKTAVGTIGFNENMLVQVFSQYPGKIIKASFNVGDDVKQGDVLFTIDSPDLLQAESSLLASSGVLELQRRTLARATNLLKAGGSAQQDLDHATSNEQPAA